MSAVLNKPRANAAKAAPGQKAGFEALRCDLRQVSEKVTLAWDASEKGSTVETLLQHVEETLMPDALEPIYRTNPTSADLNATYQALFLPLAVLESAIALVPGSAIEPILIEAHAILDAAQTQMDSAGEIARTLPEQGETSADADDADARRRLAFDSNFQVSKLAGAMTTLLEANRDDDFLIYQGMLARIQLCSELTFYLLRLHGETDESFGAPSLSNMRRMFEGAAAC